MQFQYIERDRFRRDIILAQAQSLDQLATDLRVASEHFVLGLAANTSAIAGPGLVDAAGRLIRRGASYVCCWGPGSSRLHDCFDEADVESNGSITDDRAVMTSWHDEETLEEMIEFALLYAVPSSVYLGHTRAVVIAAVANKAWAREAKRFLDSRLGLPQES
jgi:hypothetical protein